MVAKLRLVECMSAVEDPRVDRTTAHDLKDILVLSVFAVLCGADGWEDIELLAKIRFSWLKKFIKLRKGIPSHDTISRVFRMIHPDAFQECILGMDVPQNHPARWKGMLRDSIITEQPTGWRKEICEYGSGALGHRELVSLGSGHDLQRRPEPDSKGAQSRQFCIASTPRDQHPELVHFEGKHTQEAKTRGLGRKLSPKLPSCN
jgi:hypothetical protein